MNSMKQANANYDRWKDARDVKKALIEWDKETIPFTIRQYLEHPFDRSFTPEQMIDFAKFYAQRCGVVFTESINHIHLKDGVDVYKALSDFVMEKNRTLPMHDADWLEFAQYFAKRCGVVFTEREQEEKLNNQECEHPYHSVVGGNGSPERCLRCGKVLSD